ncbi:MAG: hypothetical protein RL318_967 [Fibrobacterota bacterium]|jgi:hypothetical protein
MKQLLWVLPFILASCSETISSPVVQVIPGWRTAGLEAPAKGEGDTQWVNITRAGERLIAMNSVGQLWVSKSYSSGWEKIKWNVKGVPDQLYATSESLWVSTRKPGRVYASKIGVWDWGNLGFPSPDSVGIIGLGSFHGNLIAFGVSPNQKYVNIRIAGKWTDLGNGFPIDVPYRLLEVGDTLWSATWENGLWYRVWGEASWKRQAPPLQTWFVPGQFVDDTAYHPRGLAWHRGSLWVGDWSQETTEMPGGKAPYRAARNCPPDIDTCHRDLPVNILAMTSWKDRLFVAGYFGASGHVFDDSSRQWVPLEDSWCWNNMADCGGTRTRDLVGLGDTLYAATNRFIMKFPISDLPKMTPAVAAKYRWPRDTTWRDKFLYVANPPRP